MKYLKPTALCVVLVTSTFFATVLLKEGRHLDFQNTLVFIGILYILAALFLMFAGEATYEKQPLKQTRQRYWPVGILFAGILLFLSSFVV